MSESITAATAPTVSADTTPAAPVTEATQAPVTTPQTEQPSAPLTRQDARRSLMGRIRGAREAASASVDATTSVGGHSIPSETAGAVPSPVFDQTGRAHDPGTGQFIPAGDATGSPNPAPTSAQGAADTPATHEVPAGHVRIPIPAELQRHFGNELDVPESLAEFTRWNLNNVRRNAEVQDIQRREAEAQTEILRLRAQLTAREQWNTKVLDDGTLQAYEALKAVDPQVAEAFLRGKRAELDDSANEEFTKLSTAEQERVQTEYAQHAEQRIRSTVINHAVTNWPVEVVQHQRFPSLLQAAEARTELALSNQIQMGQMPSDIGEREALAASLFAEELKHLVVRDQHTGPILTGILARNQQQAQEAQRQQLAAEAQRQATEAAAAAELQRLQAAAQRTPANPLGQIPSTIRTGAQTNTGDGDALKGLSGPSLRKAVIKQAVARAVANR